MKKYRIYSEAVYAAAIIMLSFAVAMITSTRFGVSMIVAPAYIISEKAAFLTFGQSEYVVQGILFIVLCICLKGFRPIYLTSFLTGVIYGSVLDIWRMLVPMFSPNAPLMSLGARIVCFAIGMFFTALSVAMFFRTYFYPQVYDFFVKAVSDKYKIDRTKFKMCFDGCCLLTGCVLTLVLFHGFVGIGTGTLIMTCFNGILIGFLGKTFDKYFIVEPKFKNLADKFKL